MIQWLKCFLRMHTEGEATGFSRELRCPHCKATWTEA